MIAVPRLLSAKSVDISTFVTPVKSASTVVTAIDKRIPAFHLRRTKNIVTKIPTKATRTPGSSNLTKPGTIVESAVIVPWLSV